MITEHQQTQDTSASPCIQKRTQSSLEGLDVQTRWGRSEWTLTPQEVILRWGFEQNAGANDRMRESILLPPSNDPRVKARRKDLEALKKSRENGGLTPHYLSIFGLDEINAGVSPWGELGLDEYGREMVRAGRVEKPSINVLSRLNFQGSNFQSYEERLMEVLQQWKDAKHIVVKLEPDDEHIDAFYSSFPTAVIPFHYSSVEKLWETAQLFKNEYLCDPETRTEPEFLADTGLHKKVKSLGYNVRFPVFIDGRPADVNVGFQSAELIHQKDPDYEGHWEWNSQLSLMFNGSDRPKRFTCSETGTSPQHWVAYEATCDDVEGMNTIGWWNDA